MSYVHCDQCRRAFNYVGGVNSQGCPGCASATTVVVNMVMAPPPRSSTLAELAVAMAQAINTASVEELADAQLRLRSLAPILHNAPSLGNRAMCEALAHARRSQNQRAAAAPAASLASWTRALVIATIEAATLRLVAQVEHARNARPGNRFANVVDLLPAPARLDAAKRWVAKLAA